MAAPLELLFLRRSSCGSQSGRPLSVPGADDSSAKANVGETILHFQSIITEMQSCTVFEGAGMAMIMVDYKHPLTISVDN